ncbi:MAG: hypothetical protein LBT55_06605 [Clostridiaceae bacterium]|jgi:hypothetical protein|nr:hypothetical protein [Clostridiaceae bacterium]
MKREKDIVLRRIVPIALIVILLALTLGLAIVFISRIEEEEDELPVLETVYENWMSYINDDALYAEVIKVSTHNSAAVNVKVGSMALSYLDCQEGTIYDQLMYGVRSFDFRLVPARPNGIVYFGHGMGWSEISVEQGLKDIRDFSDAHPGEFIEFSLGSYYGDTIHPEASVNYIKSAIQTYLEPEQYAFPSGTNFYTITMKEMRDSGKRFLISTQWCPPEYNSGMSPGHGTWSGDYNFGSLASGPRMYQHLYELIDSKNDKYLAPGFNRASGEGSPDGQKVTPLAYMLYDRENFLQLMSYLEANPHLLECIVGLSFDHATHDYVQPGRALLLNALKDGIIKPELRNEFITGLAEKMPDYTVPATYNLEQ